jgi:hypothetical protein
VGFGPPPVGGRSPLPRTPLPRSDTAARITFKNFLVRRFVVPRPPIDLADAERLAAEHTFFAGLTAGTTRRAYAHALLQLDHWTLYNRP